MNLMFAKSSNKRTLQKIDDKDIMVFCNVDVTTTSSSTYDCSSAEKAIPIKVEFNDDKIAGALVADPAYNDYVGRPLYGHPTNNIFRYVIDEDMTAFYPSINMAGNLHECTLIFKVILPPSEYRLTKEQKKDTQNLYAEYKGITDEFLVVDENNKIVEDISKEVFDNFLTRNYLSFGYKWLNMPDVNEVYEYLKRKE